MTENNKRFKCVCMAEDLVEFQDNGIYKCFNDIELEKLLNNLHEENQKLLTLSNMKKGALVEAVKDLIKENEQLKQSIKEIVELISEEVDLFSEKATEHDIIAYRELNQLDNKDAYYMATATKKAIKILKGCLND